MTGVRFQRPLLGVLLGSALLVTLLLHERLLRYYPDDVFTTGLLLVAGWATYTLAFYALGRLQPGARELPSMRVSDLGIALFLVSLLLALGIDTLGFTPAVIAEAYVLPAVGVYTGLALFGWSIGRRTEAINEIAG